MVTSYSVTKNSEVVCVVNKEIECGMPVAGMVEQKQYNGLTETMKEYGVTLLVSPRRNGTTSLMYAYEEKNERAKTVIPCNLLDKPQYYDDNYDTILVDESSTSLSEKYDEGFFDRVRSNVKKGKKYVFRVTPKKAGELTKKLGMNVGVYEQDPISKEHMRYMADKFGVNVSDGFIDKIDKMRYKNKNVGDVPLVSLMRSYALELLRRGRAERTVLKKYKRALEEKDADMTEDHAIYWSFDSMENSY